ncbi:MAG: divergent polysaccharide deacetylase family protein [Candidatus Hydrogenedentota bacterium]|nr:MAG: divergent polysaccharide deacetylase family protein [Candidatus Hydrogenedentota bacterium]
MRGIGYKVDLHRKTRVALLVLVLILLLAGAYGLMRLMFRHRTDTSTLATEIDSIVLTKLAEANVQPSAIRKNYVAKQNGNLNWRQIEVVIRLDESRTLTELSKNLRDGLNMPGLAIKEERGNQGTPFSELQFSVYFDNLPIYQVLLKQERVASIPKDVSKEERPRIALIVDDVGYDIERALELLNLRRPMTISIFPQLKYSRHIAEVAHDMGYEVMMHLPMEPGEKLRRNPGFITSDMREEELYQVLDGDFESIPFIVGVNNHQGSKMTRDAGAMARVMQYLAKKQVFFVDSRTTADSIAYEVARTFDLRAAENDVFLDNEKDVEYIKERMELLMQKAEQKGKAIGVCHVHPATIEALLQMFPLIDEKGIELVYASELVN